VKQDSESIQYASNELKEDKEVITEATKRVELESLCRRSSTLRGIEGRGKRLD